VTFKDLLESPQFIKIVLVTWFISSFFILFLLSKIDWIVHDSLYNFGLYFSSAWADPYWFALLLIYVCLAIPSVLGAVALGLDLTKKVNSKRHVATRPGKAKGSKVQPLKENFMIISCPFCKRVFSKPLAMLDFSSGGPRLINVCPYCSSVLSGNDKKSAEKTHVTSDKKVIH
jgi:hypothetical protein